MSRRRNILRKLSTDLEFYDNDKYYDNFDRTAYNDDNVLIETGVPLDAVIKDFNLEDKGFYKLYKEETLSKNPNNDTINSLKEQQENYYLYKVEYQLTNYDFGCNKYNSLYMHQVRENYKFNTKTNEYKTSVTTGGKKYKITYTDLINANYTTVKKVVKGIQRLEKQFQSSTQKNKAKSLQLPSKSVRTLSNRRSLQLPEKQSWMPTSVKYTEHVKKMTGIKSLLSTLDPALSDRITRTAYLQKVVEEKDMPLKDQKYVILDKTTSNLSLNDIISIFQLDYFKFNDKDEYKDDDQNIKIIDNETILLDLYYAMEEDTEELTHRYCYKKLKIDDSDKYELILAHIPLNSKTNDYKKTNDEYFRKTFTERQMERYAFDNDGDVDDFFTNNHLKDENNDEIIKKLKYKDLINIFNPEIDDYNKVVKKLNNLQSVNSLLSTTKKSL